MKRASFDDYEAMEVICFRLPIADYHALRLFAKARKKTMSMLMRQVAAEFVALTEQENNEPVNVPKKSKPVETDRIHQRQNVGASRV